MNIDVESCTHKFSDKHIKAWKFWLWPRPYQTWWAGGGCQCHHRYCSVVITPEVVFTWKPHDMPSCHFHSLGLIFFSGVTQSQSHTSSMWQLFIPSHRSLSVSPHGHCCSVVHHGWKGYYTSRCLFSPCQSISLTLARFRFPKLSRLLLDEVQMLNLALEPVLPPALSSLVPTASPILPTLCSLPQLSLYLLPVVLVSLLVTGHLVAKHALWFSSVVPYYSFSPCHPLSSNEIQVHLGKRPACVSRTNTFFFLSHSGVSRSHPSSERLFSGRWPSCRNLLEDWSHGL